MDTKGSQAMTTLEQNRSLAEIYRQLDTVRMRRWSVDLLAGAAAVVAVACLTLLAVSAGVGYLPGQPPAALRWAILAVAILAFSAAAWWFLLRRAFRRHNRAQAARFVEQHLPRLGNELINSVLLARDDEQASPELVALAIEEAARDSRSVDLLSSVSLRSLKRWAVAAAAAVVLLGAFATLQGEPFRRGLLAVLRPGGHVPIVNTLRLVVLTPGDATVFAGESVTIVAKIVNDSETSYPAHVLIEGGPAKPMFSKDGYATFACPLGQITEPIRYAVQIGQSRWPIDKPFYTLGVNRAESISLTYAYPSYTGMKERTVRPEGLDGTIEAPLGSRATVTLKVSAPLPSVWLDRQGAAPEAMRSDPAGTSFTAEIPIRADGAYRLLLKDHSGQVIQQLPDGPGSADAYGQATNGYFRIRAVPDAPPAVRFLSPAQPVTAAPGGKVEMRLKASDTYGLTDVKLYAAMEGQPAAPVSDFSASAAVGKTDAVLDYTFLLTGYVEGNVISYYAVVTDNRDLPGVGGPQSVQSRTYTITVQNAEKVAAEKARAYEELRRRLMELLKMQEPQRVNTDICLKVHKFPDELDRIHKTAGEIHDAQKKIREGMIDLVEHFPFTEDLAPVRPELAVLANNEARSAVEESLVLSRLAAADNRHAACRQLANTQDKILDALHTLLAMLPSLANRPEAKKPDAAGHDLPPEAREKLAQLKDQLGKFVDEQKKLIQASERLSKKPVDAFTAEDQQLLKELLLAQDKWENFLNEQFTDFSKLAQQDFSNPLMLKELLAVKSDITMAKDALSKQATEIATAVEDNGIENAKTLTANIEKWLPDEPDRIKWSMEDPAGGQSNPEQANLPTELEDLVGDLLEQEEDLFEQMDDLASKYAMSGDKGIGWDALDGPISNMNAQGVTGNQLPNTNELQGRSGEGRTGKSSGEFVEDKAVGKGGRRTPTRLTPEPFSKGQVNDVSQDSPGGATGGGKISGSGEEGLEGPVPPPLAQEMKRLAGKQATLVNRAEKIRSRFEVSDNANFRLLQAITVMQRVQNDLEHNRYRNVLRTRDQAVGALRQTKLLLAGGVDVQTDASTALPKYLRDDIADAMKGKLPEQYSTALEEYYRRLSEQK